MKRLLIISTLLVLASCAHIPSAVDGEGFRMDITPDMVTKQPDAHLGQSVRWGGVIVEVVNNEQETWIEILGLPLSASARPLSDRTESLGRFIVKTQEFLDPEVYQQGLRITVTGQLSKPIEGKVGERTYIYPTIDVSSHYLWPRRTPHRHYVMPGNWFYGFHPYWRFGYPYFGYGVWSYYDNFYPYFPVYGYLSRSTIRPNHYRSGNFTHSRNLDWSARERAWALRNNQFHHFPRYSRTYNRDMVGKQPLVRRPSGVIAKPSSRANRQSDKRKSIPRSVPRQRATTVRIRPPSRPDVPPRPK